MEYLLAYGITGIVAVVVWTLMNPAQPKETNVDRAIREIEAEIEEKKRQYPQYQL